MKDKPYSQKGVSSFTFNPLLNPIEALQHQMANGKIANWNLTHQGVKCG